MKRNFPYQLVAFDLDNTVLDHGKMSKKNRTALKKLQKAGIITIAATGRHIRTVPGVLRKKRLADYIIAANGATIVDAGRGEMTHQGCMKAADALYVVQSCKQHNGHVKFSEHDKVIAERTVYRLFEQLNNKAGWLGKVRTRLYFWKSNLSFSLRHTDDMEGYFSDHKIADIEKMDVYFARDEDAALAADVLAADSRYTVAKAEQYLEITSKDNSKGNALAVLCQKLRIGRAEVLAFGDSGNDLPMADHAGLFVAMGNAEDVVKQCADRIAPDVRHNGFAMMIERNIRPVIPACK